MSINKIWIGIVVVSLIILILSFTLCGILQIKRAKDNILSATNKQALDEQLVLKEIFLELTDLYLKEETNPIAFENGIKNYFLQAADIVNGLPEFNTRDISYDLANNPYYYYNGIFYPYIGRSAMLTRGNYPIIGETLSSTSDILNFFSNRMPLEPLELLETGKSENSFSSNGQDLNTRKIDNRYIVIIRNDIELKNYANGSVEKYCIFTITDVTDIYKNISDMTLNYIWLGLICSIVGTVIIALFVKMSMRRTVQKHIAQLEDVAQRQQLFVRGLTHEIKTPLTSMLLHTDTLLTADLSAKAARNSLMHLYEQCRWTERLSQKLLMLLTTEENLDIRPIEASKLFNDVSKIMEDTLQKRNTPLVIECKIDTLEADYDLMKSLIINLVDNASKASEQGQEIKLRGYKSKNVYSENIVAESTNIIEVSDNGIGISKDELARVTDIFYMVDRSRSKKQGGSGLGLALVKRIADAHKVKLQIESELSQGTTVRVVF